MHVAIQMFVALAVSAAGVIPYPYGRIADKACHDDPLQMPADSNAVELIEEGARFFESLLEDISSAKESINMECFKFLDDSTGRMVRDAIVAKAREGVKVRLIVENVSHPFQSKSFYEQMRQAGVHVLYATDLYQSLDLILRRINNREHRKTIIIDDRIVSTGGMNLTVQYLSEWADVHLRIEGPVVARFARKFYDYWHELGGEYPPSRVEVPPAAGGITVQALSGGPGMTSIPDGIMQALESARDYIWFETGYLSPPDELLEALGKAAGRGVDVRILISEHVDIRMCDFLNEYYMKKALESGVRVFLYQPCFNHSKTIVCDDCFCAAGSANLVIRSMYINYEHYTFMYDRDFALEMKRMHIEREKDCRELTLEETEGWSPWRRFMQRVVNLIHPLV